MEQQQFQLSLSVGTKLLLSVVALVFISIAFLDFSTIFLVERDKRAYVFQSQSTTAVLVGREFTSMTRNVIDTLRLSLASVDPSKPIQKQARVDLQSVVDNQSSVLGVSVESIELSTGKGAPLASAGKGEELNRLGLPLSDLKVSDEFRKQGIEELTKKGLTFANATQVGKPPFLAIIVADLQGKSLDGGLPVAIGYVSLKEFGHDFGAIHLRVVNREGWLLFDTNTADLFAMRNVSDDPLYELALTSQVSTGTQEYFQEGDRLLGSYVRPGYDLLVLASVEWRTAMSATYTLMEKFILLGCMFVGAAIIFAILFSKSLTAPLKQLYEATKVVARGDFNINLQTRSRDEIGALSSSFNVMSKKIGELIEEKTKAIHLENELKIASTVQQTLIPPSHFENENILIKSHYQSANECGGDWWGFFGVGKKMCLMIADATGHGLPSALITASARSCFSVLAKLASEDPDFSYSPAAMLSYANRVIYDAASTKIMMTFFVATIDFDAKTLTYASAGHNPPWLFKREGDKFTLKSLTSQGMRLGEVRDADPFEEKSVSIGPEDLLFLYTDGLMEGKNLNGDMYGKKRTRKIVESTLSDGPQTLIEKLMKDFLEHNGDKPLDDDVTLAVARVLKVTGAA